MVARLAQLAKEVDSGRSAFWELQSAGSEEARARPQDSSAETAQRVALARGFLVDGRNEDAIGELEAAWEHIASASGSFPTGFADLVLRQLGIAYMRLAEQENCVAGHNPDSCLLPIRGTGVHRIERGSRAAMDVYATILGRRPTDANAVWLLNIAAMTLGRYPDEVPEKWRIPPEVFESDHHIERFYDVAPDVGLDVNALSGGVVLEDFDRDGDLDVMASSWELSDQLRFFRNEGDGTFADRTDAAGLKGLTGGLNLVHADYDNDGWPDVLVLRGAWLGSRGRHPNSLLRNLAGTGFADVTVTAGIADGHPTQTAAWADYDRDGWLDLFVGNESSGREGHPVQLFHNDGDGSFTDVADEVGIVLRSYVKGAAWGDIDNDGLDDLYVSNLDRKNVLFRNEGRQDSGNWLFREVDGSAGVDEPVTGFPTWFWDYDNDGHLDILALAFPVAILRGEASEVAADYLGLATKGATPHLYRNQGDGSFRDVTAAAKLDRVLYTMGANFGDIDNDGYPDIYLGTGAPSYEALMPNRMFRNDAGSSFQDVTTSGGFGHLQKGHGVAFGDVDGDGDQDVYAVMGGAYKGDAYQNALFVNPGNAHHWVTLRLEGVRSNRSAIGSRIRILVEQDGRERAIYTTVTTGGSFGSNSLQQEIGLGAANAIRRVEITWPSAQGVQVFEDVPMDRILAIREGDAEPRVVRATSIALPRPGARPGREHVH